MKNIYLILLFLFSFGLCFSQTQESLSVEEQQRREKNIQAGNPFEKFGYKPKILTLSNGKYLEFHDQDSIVQIGSFTYHVKKKIITGYILKETKYSEANLRPEIVSRWFSPDPLASEFPSWSPYVFTNDNPIFFTDPTGLAPEVCCGKSLTSGVGIGNILRKINRTAQYMSDGNSLATAYLKASGDDIIDGTKQTLRYASPAEDLYGVATGEDFYGSSYHRGEAGAWAAASFIPFAKFGKLSKVFSAGLKVDDIGGFASKKLLDQHYIDHAGEFAGIFRNAEEYLKGAQDFFNRGSDNIIQYTRSNGDIVRYDTANNIFGVARKDGTIRTMFKPDDGLDYFKGEVKQDLGEQTLKEFNRILK